MTTHTASSIARTKAAAGRTVCQTFATLAEAFEARRQQGGLKQILVRFAAGGAVGSPVRAG